MSKHMTVPERIEDLRFRVDLLLDGNPKNTIALKALVAAVMVAAWKLVDLDISLENLKSAPHTWAYGALVTVLKWKRKVALDAYRSALKGLEDV